jgi:phage tail protein X
MRDYFILNHHDTVGHVCTRVYTHTAGVYYRCSTCVAR